MLKLNCDKTEFLVVSTPQLQRIVANSSLTFAGTTIHPTASAYEPWGGIWCDTVNGSPGVRTCAKDNTTICQTLLALDLSVTKEACEHAYRACSTFPHWIMTNTVLFGAIYSQIQRHHVSAESGSQTDSLMPGSEIKTNTCSNISILASQSENAYCLKSCL